MKASAWIQEAAGRLSMRYSVLSRLVSPSVPPDLDVEPMVYDLREHDGLVSYREAFAIAGGCLLQLSINFSEDPENNNIHNWAAAVQMLPLSHVCAIMAGTDATTAAFEGAAVTMNVDFVSVVFATGDGKTTVKLPNITADLPAESLKAYRGLAHYIALKVASR